MPSRALRRSYAGTWASPPASSGTPTPPHLFRLRGCPASAAMATRQAWAPAAARSLGRRPPVDRRSASSASPLVRPSSLPEVLPLRSLDACSLPLTLTNAPQTRQDSTGHLLLYTHRSVIPQSGPGQKDGFGLDLLILTEHPAWHARSPCVECS